MNKCYKNTQRTRHSSESNGTGVVSGGSVKVMTFRKHHESASLCMVFKAKHKLKIHVVEDMSSMTLLFFDIFEKYVCMATSLISVCG